MAKWLNYFHKEIWQVDLTSLPKGKAYWIRFLRIVVLISQGFSKSQIQQGASSLTYYTLLGVVPVIALLAGLARGFGFEDVFKKWLLRELPEQRIIIDRLFQYAYASLQSAHQSVIAGVGILILLWAGIKIFLNIESVLNKIWEVQSGRSFARKFTDYLAMLILCPLIVFISSGISVYLSATLSAVISKGFLGSVAPVILPLIDLIPFSLICLLLTFLYIFLPNTRVRFLPALWAGVFSAIVYQLIQWLYLYFQIGVSSYNAIYGTFAALPLFLIWVHLSWVIVLLGAKVSFALQNVNAFDFISEDVQLSHRFRTILSLRIVHLCVKDFCEGKTPPSHIEISNKLSIPLPLTGNLLYQLTEAGVLSEVKRDGDQEFGFQPSRSVEQLTIKKVVDMINNRGESITLPPSPELDLILKSLDTFSQAIEESEGNIPLSTIYTKSEK